MSFLNFSEGAVAQLMGCFVGNKLRNNDASNKKSPKMYVLIVLLTFGLFLYEFCSIREVVTFSAPRVGDKNWVEAFMKSVSIHWRHVNTKDVVPNMGL